MCVSKVIGGRKINSKGVWTLVIVLDPGHSAVVASGYEPLGPGSGQNAYVKETKCRKQFVWETDSMTGNNWSKVPTTIIEDRLMQQSAYQKKMVTGIANGIRDFLIG